VLSLCGLSVSDVELECFGRLYSASLNLLVLLTGFESREPSMACGVSVSDLCHSQLKKTLEYFLEFLIECTIDNWVQRTVRHWKHV